MKRQIIKTRSQKPYTVARVIIVLMLMLVAAAAVYVALAHRTHTTLGAFAARTTVRQDFPIFGRKSQSPAILT